MEENKDIHKVQMMGLFFTMLISFFYMSQKNYLLFHASAEGISIVISFAVFIIAWHSRRFLGNEYLIFLGFSYLFIGFLDFLHILSYRGMSVFQDLEFHANQLWIAARYFESIIIYISVGLIGSQKKPSIRGLLLIYSSITFFIVYSIFFSNLFPVCYVENLGQTPFKVISEIVIIVILLFALYKLFNKKALLQNEIARFLVISLIMTVLSELAFTLYTDLFGILNVIGHLFKIVSFYFIYKAIVVTGIRDPYNSIFKALSDKNAEVTHLNQELEESLKEQERLNREKSLYLSIITHDMRTPVNGMYGVLQLFRMTDINAEQSEYLTLLERTSNTLRRMIDNILDIEKYLSGKAIFNDVHQYIRPSIESERDMFMAMAIEKGLDLQWENRVEASQVAFLDEDKITRLIDNLVTNAIKFTAKGHIMLESWIEDIDGFKFLYIQVSDQGIGMTDTEVGRLFKPFVQVNDNHNSRYGGTGLGLAICKQIADHYMGDIQVESKPGQGTVFYVKLKLKTI